MSRWFRHYAGMMRDDKLVRVAIRSKQTIERVAWVWGAILESAAEIDDNGRYDVDAAEVAYFLRADPADVDAITAALADAGRVAKGAVVKWGNRQFSSDRSKERVAAHRERKREARDLGNDQSEEGNSDVTLQGCYRNAPETETELETEGCSDEQPKARKRALSLLKAEGLPDWLPAEPWLAFVRMRKSIPKVAFTEDAAKGVISKLDALRGRGYDPGKLLLRSVESGWRTVFPHDDCKAEAKPSSAPSAAELEERARFYDKIGKPDDAAECRRKAAQPIGKVIPFLDIAQRAQAGAN